MNPPRIAAVTGAASGIGAAYAERLGGAGYELLLIDRNGEGLRAVCASLAAMATPVCADLATGEGRAAATAVLEAADRLDLLVHCAGIGEPGGYLETPPEELRRVFEVNAVAGATLARACGAKLAEHRGGMILVSSVGGLGVGYAGAAYGASKSFLDHLARALDLQWRKAGVRVQSLCPGYVRTPIHNEAEARLIPRCLYAAPRAVVDASLRRIERGGGRCVPGWRSKTTLLLVRVRRLHAVFRLLRKAERLLGTRI